MFLCLVVPVPYDSPVWLHCGPTVICIHCLKRVLTSHFVAVDAFVIFLWLQNVDL
jgi:hypothetical protein